MRNKDACFRKTSISKSTSPSRQRKAKGGLRDLKRGEARLGALLAALIESGRSEEVALVATDADARRARFEEFSL